MQLNHFYQEFDAEFAIMNTNTMLGMKSIWPAGFLPINHHY